MTGKPSFDQYLLKAASELGFPGDAVSAERAYDISLVAARVTVQSSHILSGVLNALKEIPQRYAGGNPNLLFYPAVKIDEFPIVQKPFKSTIDKLYRRNVLFNRAYPNPPRDGFIETGQLYEAIDDLLRTRLICKYMDGPKYVCDELTKHCGSLGVQSTFRELSTDAGYYAWHFYFKVPVLISMFGKVETKNMWIEIQLSTQLAEAIDTLTHGLYEARRAGHLDASGSKAWKWDASSQRFRAAYIGHGLHLLEGIIQSYKDEILGPGAPETPAHPSEPVNDPELSPSLDSGVNRGEPKC